MHALTYLHVLPGPSRRGVVVSSADTDTLHVLVKATAAHADDFRSLWLHRNNDAINVLSWMQQVDAHLAHPSFGLRRPCVAFAVLHEAMGNVRSYVSTETSAHDIVHLGLRTRVARDQQVVAVAVDLRTVKPTPAGSNL